jgi:flagellar secretion chaperone FliS
VSNPVENVYLKNRSLAADAVELIHLLYEHAMGQIAAARVSMACGDLPGRSQAISKALAILGELEGSLDHRAGGAISQNLASLYQYMRRRLLDANVNKDAAALPEVESLFRTLDEGWTAMQKASARPPVEAPVPMAAARMGTFAAHMEVEQVAHSWSA